MEQTKYDVFISYSRHDYVDDHENVIPNNEVSKIMEALTDAGITYWIDKEGIYSGDKFTEELPKIIKLAPIFVYLSTANANKSKYTSKEIAIADEYGKYIIPVRIDMTPYSEKVIFRIADVSFIKYAVNPAKGREDLVKSIKAFLEKEKHNELKKQEERLRKEELDRQRHQQEDEKKRQEKISQIETEIAALESQKIECEKKVLQKEQELKLAQIDLKACERKLQSKQEKLSGLLMNSNSSRLAEIFPKEIEKSSGKFNVEKIKESSKNQTKELKHDWDFSEILVKSKKVSSVFERDDIEKSIDVFKFQEILYDEYGILLDFDDIISYKTIGKLKDYILKRVKEDRFWKGDK